MARMMNGITDIIEYCRQRRYEFYPTITDARPSYASVLMKHIQERAERDLPRAQIEGNLEEGNLAHLVEMAGLLSIKDGIIEEVIYSKPDVSMLYRENGFIVCRAGATSCMFPMSPFEQKGGDIVDYHSHPDGGGELSDGDVDNMMQRNRITRMLKSINPAI